MSLRHSRAGEQRLQLAHVEAHVAVPEQEPQRDADEKDPAAGQVVLPSLEAPGLGVPPTRLLELPRPHQHDGEIVAPIRTRRRVGRDLCILDLDRLLQQTLRLVQLAPLAMVECGVVHSRGTGVLLVDSIRALSSLIDSPLRSSRSHTLPRSCLAAARSPSTCMMTT